MTQQAIGWAASAVLLATIGTQIYRQWKIGTSHGVSRWLFVGQFVASAGFAVYSVPVRDVVFIFTNCLMASARSRGTAWWSGTGGRVEGRAAPA